MAAGTRRPDSTDPGRGPRGFRFTLGLSASPPGASKRARWLYRLAAIPVAIAAIAFAIFSLVFLAVVTLAAVSAYGIAWWWRRRKASRAASGSAPLEGDYFVVDPVVARDQAPRKIAAPVEEPAGSPR